MLANNEFIRGEISPELTGVCSDLGCMNLIALGDGSGDMASYCPAKRFFLDSIRRGIIVQSTLPEEKLGEFQEQQMEQALKEVRAQYPGIVYLCPENLDV